MVGSLKRIDLSKDPFSSCALVIDESIKDSKAGKMVAWVSYSSGGNVIVWFKEGYDVDEVLVAGEKFLGETLRASRYKEFRAEVLK